MNKKKIFIALAVTIVLLLIVVGAAMATSRKKCKSVYNGSTRVAKICYTMSVTFRGSTGDVKCNSQGALQTYVYSPSYQWKAKVASCSPYSWTWRAKGGGAASLFRNGSFWKNKTVNCRAYGEYGTFSCY